MAYVSTRTGKPELWLRSLDKPYETDAAQLTSNGALHPAWPAFSPDGGLLASAEYLNGKMREIRDSGKVVGLDRVAVMAALNITNELLLARNAVPDETAEAELAGRVRSLRERVESALEQGRQLEL